MKQFYFIVEKNNAMKQFTFDLSELIQLFNINSCDAIQNKLLLSTDLLELGAHREFFR